jgi:hypothetical protein
VAAGFYYTSRGDIVSCAFCGVEVGWWQKEDSPVDDHKLSAHLVDLLRALLLEILLLTSLKHLKNLPVVNRCADVGSRAFFLKIILLTSLNLLVVEMCADHLWS